WVSAGIDATFEKLRQDGAITVEVVNLAGDQSSAQAEQQALALFKDQILSQWFSPSLSPTTQAAADAGIPSFPGARGNPGTPPTSNPMHPTSGTTGTLGGAMGGALGNAMGGAPGGQLGSAMGNALGGALHPPSATPSPTPAGGGLSPPQP